MKKILLLLALLLPINIFADDEPTEDSGPWSNSLLAGFNLTSGNSNTSLLNIGLTSNYEKDENIFKFKLDHGFGKTEDKTTGLKDTNVDYTFANAHYKRVLNKKIYAGFGTDLQRNQISEVKYRVFVNPVLGFFLFKNENGFLDLYAGPSYILEEVDHQSEGYLAPRIGNSFEYQITENAKVFEKFDVFISAEDRDNYIITAETGMETKISDGVNLIIKLKDVYDNQPAADLEKNYLAMITSIGVAF